MDAPVSHPNFSRLLPCVCKLEEQRARSQANVRAFSDLSAFRDLTFESFDSLTDPLLAPLELPAAKAPPGFR
jgi:hypothetical protein